MFFLENKLALITGGTSGIGLAVANQYVEAGAKVVLCGRRDGCDIAREIGAHFMQLDVSDEQQAARVLEQVETEYGKIDILVNNAGIALDLESIESTDCADMKKIMEINCYGVYYALKYAPRHMKDGASIINTGSIAGSGVTSAGNAEYAMSKATVAYMTRTAAIELGPRGIRVNAVCPGLIAGTGMMTEDNGSPVAQFCANLTALGRMGRVDEVVGLYQFLASDASTFITGQELRVDGGVTAGRSQATAGILYDACL